MITTKRRILISQDAHVLDFVSRFEGIELIRDFNKVPNVWGLNKTPVLTTVSQNNLDGLDILEIPSNVTEDEFINFSHSHGFECGEYITGEVFDTRDEPCVLCAIAQHKGLTPDTSVYNSHVDKEVDMIIYESPNFLVIPELGSLMAGFLMIIPRSHQFLSVAQFADNRVLFREYREVCSDTEEILRKAFGDLPVVFFEHGSDNTGKSGHRKSIVHAHTHVLIGYTMPRKYLDMVRCHPVKDIAVAKCSHYFAYRHRENLFCTYNPNVYVQRQFMRQVISLELGNAPDQFNWRHYQWLDNVSKTLYYLYKALKNGNVSSQIRTRTSAFIKGYEMRRNIMRNK